MSKKSETDKKILAGALLALAVALIAAPAAGVLPKSPP